nr:hypothetical protein CFP56_00490 [Quercus suber]
MSDDWDVVVMQGYGRSEWALWEAVRGRTFVNGSRLVGKRDTEEEVVLLTAEPQSTLLIVTERSRLLYQAQDVSPHFLRERVDAPIGAEYCCGVQSYRYTCGCGKDSSVYAEWLQARIAAGVQDFSMRLQPCTCVTCD